MNRVQHLKQTLQKLSTRDICHLFLAIGFTLIVLGRFLDPNSLAGFMIENGGWVVFLCGIAMFVAIARTTLDY